MFKSARPASEYVPVKPGLYNVAKSRLS